MAVSSTSIDWNNVNTFTGRRMLPRTVDNIFRSNPLMMKLWKNGTKLDGGAYIVQGLVYAEGPGGAFEGMEEHDVSEAEIATAAIFNWKHYYASVTIRRMDELKNRGRAAFGRILSTRMRTAEKTLRNLLGQGIYSDGSFPKSITGVRAMVTGTGVVYGNIDKTTNSWWRSQIDSTSTLANLAADTDLSILRTLMGSATEDADSPNLITTTQTIYNTIYGLLPPLQRFGSGAMADAGFKSLLFEGRPIVVDSHCPTGFLYMLNTDFIDFITHEDENFRWEPFQKPIKQAGRTGIIYWAGNLTGSNCRFQAAATALV